MHPKLPLLQIALFPLLNDTLLTNFPLLTLTHPILKKQHNDFITQAPKDRDS